MKFRKSNPAPFDLRDHPWAAVLFFAAVVYAIYEPAARAAYLPFMRDSRVFFGFSVIAYVAIWLPMFRHRHAYWSGLPTQNKAIKILFAATGVLVLPLLFSATAAVWPSWVTYHFGTTPVARQLVIDEVADFRKFRRPFVEIVGRDVQINAIVNLEWAVAENPRLPKPDKSWIGKTVCISGISAWPGTLVQRMEFCTQ
ncbi:MAG: hypothetical protein QG616_1497 [Pseudomonadota bacterium]|nr:hypothetical protein [Pseudomonadota bacterium]